MYPEIHLGGATLQTYETWGVLTAGIYALALALLARRAGFCTRDWLVVGVVCGLALYLGSGLFFEIFEYPFMKGRMWIDPPPAWLRPLRPMGFTFLGGLAALGLGQLVLGLTPLVRPGPGRILDVVTPVTALVFALSKVGCLLAGCCHGRPTDAWWGVTMMHLHTDAPEKVVPVRILEMLVSLAVAGAGAWILWGDRARGRVRDGVLFASYLLVASVTRFALGFLRGDYEIRVGPLDGVQWGALGIALVAAVVLVVLLAVGPGRKATEEETS